MIQQLTDNRLFIAPDKIQHNRPLNYLEKFIYKMSQKKSVRFDKLKTLNDFQRSLTNTNWVQPSLKITTEKLHVLFKALKDDSNPKSKRILTLKMF